MASEILELDSKGLCFVCFKACHPKSLNYQGPQTSTSLKAFLQYLKLDVSRLANFQSEILDGEGITPGAEVNLSAVLCDGCISEMNKFLKLYQRMEIIQRQMEESCLKMHRLIHMGDTEFGRKEEFRRRFQSRRLSDMFNASLLENIRREAKEKCFEKIKDSQQVTLSHGMELVVAQGVHASASFNGGEFHSEMEESEYPEQKPIANMDVDMMNDSTSIQTQQQVDEVAPLGQDVEEGLEHGPDVEEGLEHEQFSGVNEEPTPGCSKHAFGRHSKIIAVRSLRSPPNPSPANATVKKVTEGLKKSKCLFCGVKFPRLSICLNHMLAVHPVNVLEDAFPSAVTNEVVFHAVSLLLTKTIGKGSLQGPRRISCPECSMELRGVSTLKCHFIKSHLDKVVLELKKQLHLDEGAGHSLATEEERQAFLIMAEERVQKALRKVTGTTTHHSQAEGAGTIRSSSKEHKSPKHNSATVDAKTRPKRKTGPGLSLSEPRKESAATPKDRPKPHSRKRLFSEGTTRSSRAEEEINCPHCAKRYPAINFPYHLKNKHPVQAFKELLPPATTDEDFKAATNLAMNELYSTWQDEQFGCAECKKKYTAMYALKYHLFSSHMDKVIVKLKAKQGKGDRSASASPPSHK